MGLAKGQTTSGDIRLDRRRETIVERIVATGSLVQRKVGGNRNGEMAMKNFLASPKVTSAYTLTADIELTSAVARGRRVVAAQDTTEVNFSGRDKRRNRHGKAPTCLNPVGASRGEEAMPWEYWELPVNV